jgi:predicted nucleotidyltransferase
MSEDSLKIAQKYLRLVSEKFEVEKSFLFGSFSKKNATEESDIDIALILPNVTDFFKTQLELMRIRRKIDLRIEPHVFASADFDSNNPLAFEIMQTGIKVNAN